MSVTLTPSELAVAHEDIANYTRDYNSLQKTIIEMQNNLSENTDRQNTYIKFRQDRLDQIEAILQQKVIELDTLYPAITYPDKSPHHYTLGDNSSLPLLFTINQFNDDLVDDQQMLYIFSAGEISQINGLMDNMYVYNKLQYNQYYGTQILINAFNSVLPSFIEKLAIMPIKQADYTNELP